VTNAPSKYKSFTTNFCDEIVLYDLLSKYTFLICLARHASLIIYTGMLLVLLNQTEDIFQKNELETF